MFAVFAYCVYHIIQPMCMMWCIPWYVHYCISCNISLSPFCEAWHSSSYFVTLDLLLLKSSHNGQCTALWGGQVWTFPPRTSTCCPEQLKRITGLFITSSIPMNKISVHCDILADAILSLKWVCSTIITPAPACFTLAHLGVRDEYCFSHPQGVTLSEDSNRSLTALWCIQRLILILDLQEVAAHHGKSMCGSWLWSTWWRDNSLPQRNAFTYTCLHCWHNSTQNSVSLSVSTS